jgi:hypothetical protein
MVVAEQTLGGEEGGVFVSANLATTISGSVTLPFVIPTRIPAAQHWTGPRVRLSVKKGA